MIGSTSGGTEIPSRLPISATNPTEITYATATVSSVISGASGERRYSATVSAMITTVTSSISGSPSSISSACSARAGIAPVIPTNSPGGTSSART